MFNDRIDPAQLGPDELFLSGRIQVDAAIDALVMTGLNPAAQSLLRALRDAHAVATEPDAKDDLTVYLQGGQAEEIKKDIAASALLAERNHRLSDEKRAAAAGLLGVLGIEQ